MTVLLALSITILCPPRLQDVMIVSAKELQKSELEWMQRVGLAKSEDQRKVVAEVSEDVSNAGGVLLRSGSTIMIATPSLARVKVKELRLRAYVDTAKSLKEGGALRRFADMPPGLQAIATDIVGGQRFPEGRKAFPNSDTTFFFSVGTQVTLTDGVNEFHHFVSQEPSSEHFGAMSRAQVSVSEPQAADATVREEDRIDSDRLIGPTLYVRHFLDDRVLQTERYSEFWVEFGKWEADWKQRTSEAKGLALDAAAKCSGAPDWLTKSHAGMAFDELPEGLQQELANQVRKRASFLRSDAEVDLFLRKARVSRQRDRVQIGFALPPPRSGAVVSGF